jgi:hypothetical protein
MKQKARLSQLQKELYEEPAETRYNLIDEKPIEANIPRGQRAEFLKITITMPADMLSALKTTGMKRKATGAKDCDTSALIREAVLEWLSKQ